MTRSTEISLEFGGEDRIFKLPIGRMVALQEKTDCGPYELHRRFAAGEWRIHDLRETILQGLIGGGADVATAGALMKSFFDDLPSLQFVPLANAVVMAALSGVEDEPLGESPAGTGKPKSRSRATKSDSARSTKSAGQ